MRAQRRYVTLGVLATLGLSCHRQTLEPPELLLRGRPYELKGGEALHIPPQVRHGFTAGGQQRLTAVQIYTPAGPERRFMKSR
jgi:hypothetical protein